MLCVHQRSKYALLRLLCAAKSNPQIALIGRLQFPCDFLFLQNDLPVAKEFGESRAVLALYQQQNSRMCGHVQLAGFQPGAVPHDLSHEEKQTDLPSLPTMPPIRGVPFYVGPGLVCE